MRQLPVGGLSFKLIWLVSIQAQSVSDMVRLKPVQTGNVQNWSSDLIERSHLLAASPLVFFSFYTKHVISKYPLFPCTIKAEKNEVANWTSVHHLCWTVKALTDTRWRYKNRKLAKSNVLHATNSKLKSVNRYTKSNEVQLKNPHRPIHI